jgi:pimeloyl-ACP methyl ester carboxylesterase
MKRLEVRKPRRRTLVGAAVAVAVLVAASVASAVDGTFDVGGRKLYIQCEGSGSPAIVFESGLTVDHSVWETYIGDLAPALGTQVCAYDRYGLGQSGHPSRMTKRSIVKTAQDKHALLAAAGLKGPYVLVSTSMGGLIDRYYAKVFPNEVAGLVQLDAAPDDWDLYTKRRFFNENFIKLEIRTASKALRAGDKLGDRPLIVVKAADSDSVAFWAPSHSLKAFRKYWNARQRGLAKKSSNSIFFVAKGTTHDTLPGIVPPLISQGVELVFRAAQSGEELPSCVQTQLPKLGARC